MLLLDDLADPAVIDGARLGDRLVLLAMQSHAAEQRLGSRALPPPYGSVAVSGPAGPHSIVALSGTAPTAVDAFSLLGDDPLGAVRMDADPLALADGLDATSQRRLLDFLLGFCRTAFRVGDDPAFATLCLRLAHLCARDAGAAVPVANVPPGRLVLGGVSAPSDSQLYLLGGRQVRRSVYAPAGAAGLQLIEMPAEGEAVLALGTSATLWSVAPPRGLPLLAALAPERQAACRAACLQALRRSAEGSADAALRRELQWASPAAPRSLVDMAHPVGGSLELALPDREGGLFLRGWLRDPAGLVAAMEVAGLGGRAPLPVAKLHRVRRDDVRERYAASTHRDADGRTGFVAYLDDPRLAGSVQPVLRLRLHSGATVDLTPTLQTMPPDGARNSVLASVAPPEVTAAMMRDCIAPAAGALHRMALDQRCTVDAVQFGTPVARPEVSLAIPLYRQLGFLRFQLAALAADPDAAGMELIYVLDSPEQREEAEHLLRGLHHLHALPITLLVPERNLGFAQATNLAAARARARTLLLMNSDVVPLSRGWLRVLRAGMGRAVAAGPKLLFDDESIQHAGLFFQRDPDGIWFNQHHHKGMPRHWQPAQRTREVAGVTGAALLVDRERFELVGGVCPDYIIGDYEDSDLCLRLAAAGGSIRYVAGAELFHFERRSIALHPGYTRTLASQYNRLLHHGRWDASMTSAMRRGRA